MSQVTLANTVTFLSGLLLLLGVTGVTSADLTGFVNVAAVLVAIASTLWSHFAHRAQVQTLSGGRVKA